MSFADAPAPTQTRTEHSLARIASAWRSAPNGGRFVVGLRDWLRSARSPGTLKVYARGALDFFEWYEFDRGSIVTPDRVTRADVAAYETWLRTRTVGLQQHRLDTDPTRALDRAIHEFVGRNPGAGIDAIRAALRGRTEFSTDAVDPSTGEAKRILRIDRDCRGGLAGHLALLTKLRVLDRRPKVHELRRAAAAQAKERGERPETPYATTFDPRLFRYSTVRQQVAPGPARSSGAVTKLAVLSSLWSYLGRPGNAPGEEPLIRYNVWADRTLIDAVREQGKSFTVARRREQTPDDVLFRRVLALTFRRSHGDAAAEAASAAVSGLPVPKGRATATFSDLRDRALLLVMLQAGGPRAAEIGSMRSRDLVDGVLRIYGKGGKVRAVPLPQPALDALEEFKGRLSKIAAHHRKYGRNPRAERLLGDDAPLIPAIKHWGANAGAKDEGLSRQAIIMRLHQLADRVGSTAVELLQLHPHGVRRLYAKMDLEAGTPLHVVQRKMGHASGSTTMAYAEEVDPRKLVSRAFEQAPAARQPLQAPTPMPVAPRPAPAPRPRPAAADLPTAEELMRVTPPPLLVRRVTAPAQALGGPPGLPVSEPSRYLSEALQRPLTETEQALLAPCASSPDTAGKLLCGIYAIHWGEPGTRTRVMEPATEVAAMERSTWGATRTLITVSDARRLGQVYCGLESGLSWWAGTRGDFEEELPVPSPRQVGDCGTSGGLCQEIAALWQKWMASPDEAVYSTEGVERLRGPSAARALVAWVDEILDAAAELDAAVSRRGGRWVGSGAEWGETALGGAVRHRPPRVVFREHREGEILGWIERHAWQHRTSRGKPDETRLGKSYREPKPVTAPLRAPHWYGSADPIADLPPPERAELLDLLSVLTGQGGPTDTTGRFMGGRSRASLSPLLTSLRDYERALAEARTLRHEQAGGSLEEESSAAKARARDRLAAANAELARLGHPDVNVSDWVRRRAQVRRSAAGGRESIASSHLALIGELFGAQASADRIVRLAVSGGEKTEKGAVSSPLGDYKDLFHIDRQRRTIVHEDAFKRTWAERHGTHSECVARRSARELWELWRLGGKGSSAFERRRELVDLVRSLAAYRVPCPGSMERELRDLLGSAAPIPIYEVWEKHTYEREREEPSAAERAREEASERRAELREHLREVTGESEYGGIFGGEERARWNANPRARSVPVQERALRSLPNPVRLLFAIARHA